jgi:hypothetical protein
MPEGPQSGRFGENRSAATSDWGRGSAPSPVFISGMIPFPVELRTVGWKGVSMDNG